MFKILGLISLSTQSLSQPVNGDIMPVYDYHPIGGDNDANGCLISAGYSWCEANSECIRSWITPCEDNFNGCSDCLSKQQKGVNIACPTECNLIIDQLPVAIDPMEVPSLYPSIPMPPPPMPMPMPPMRPHPVDPLPCPEVMCMMYCENGFQLDDSGCNMCSCLSPIPMAPHQIIDMLNPVADIPGECPIPYTTCNNDYVCPKVTEVTHCSQDGISGYTTYQLSLVIQNPTVRNIYAIYGDSQFGDHPMSFPPAYQGTSIYDSNLGGVSPVIIAINRDGAYDSWLTIGITDGDKNNQLASVGIDFNSWTDTVGIYTTNAAVFLMDSDEDITQEPEHIIAQITIRDDQVEDVIVNVQGKLHCSKIVMGQCLDTAPQTWQETQITFHLEKPQVANPNVIPDRCLSWFDGCNTCRVSNGNLMGCTRMMCFREDNPHCLSFDMNGH